MNTTKTHFKLNHNKHCIIYTPAFGSCYECLNVDPNIGDNIIPIIVFCKVSETPKPAEYENCRSYCKNHLLSISCKRQNCINCNKKAIIKEDFLLCTDCIESLINNNSEMAEVCQYPDVERSKCFCKYCKRF